MVDRRPRITFSWALRNGEALRRGGGQMRKMAIEQGRHARAFVLVAVSALAACVGKSSASKPAPDQGQDQDQTAAVAATDLGRRLGELRGRISTTYRVALPAMPIPVNNPQNDAKIALGRALFFDPNLSSCGTIACASCHLPEKGF